MPNRDGTGPLEQGPATGRGMGPCGGGRAFGRGFGRGIGRGFRSFLNFGRSYAVSRKDEKGILSQEAKNLENELKAVKKRLSEIENQD